MRKTPAIAAFFLLCLILVILGAAWKPDAFTAIVPDLSRKSLGDYLSAFLGQLPSKGRGHDPFAAIMLELTLLIGMVIAARWLAARMHQPPVLGELLIGALLGNLGYWLGLPFFSFVMDYGSAAPLFEQVWRSGASVLDAATRVFGPQELLPGGHGYEVVQLLTGTRALANVNSGVSLWLFSSLGIVLLLFNVGLKTGVRQLREVGAGAARVAVAGALGSLVLGLLVAWLLLGDTSLAGRIFIAAALCATSIGISTRVLEDIGRHATPEGQMILGACVLNDLIGLVLLAVCIELVVKGRIEYLSVAWLLVASGLFLAAIVLFSDRFGQRLAQQLNRIRTPEIRFLLPLAFAFFLGWVCSELGLSGTVGGFAAGLILSDEALREKTKEMLMPLIALFTPIFFLLIGMQVNLAAFLHWQTLVLTLALLFAAVAGKLPAALVAGPTVDHLTVGLGMLPRGEVALIFVGVGKSLGVIPSDVFAALIVVIITLAFGTGIALKWAFGPRPPALQRFARLLGG